MIERWMKFAYDEEGAFENEKTNVVENVALCFQTQLILSNYSKSEEQRWQHHMILFPMYSIN